MDRKAETRLKTPATPHAYFRGCRSTPQPILYCPSQSVRAHFAGQCSRRSGLDYLSYATAIVRDHGATAGLCFHREIREVILQRRQKQQVGGREHTSHVNFSPQWTEISDVLPHVIRIAARTATDHQKPATKSAGLTQEPHSARQEGRAFSRLPQVQGTRHESELIRFKAKSLARLVAQFRPKDTTIAGVGQNV